MSKMICDYGVINGVYMSCQLRNHVLAVQHWWDDGSLTWGQVREKLLEDGYTNVYFIRFSSFKAFAEQMMYAQDTVLGTHMERLYREYNLRELKTTL